MKQMRKIWDFLLAIVFFAVIVLPDTSVCYADENQVDGYTINATEYTCAKCGQTIEGVTSVKINNIEKNGIEVTFRIDLCVACKNCDYSGIWFSAPQTFISENGCMGEFRATRSISAMNWGVPGLEDYLGSVTITLTGPIVPHTGGTATFYEEAVCEVCNNHYGEKLENTENTAKVKDINAINVSVSDKENLLIAKADYEKALNEYAGNFTEEEKRAIEGKIVEIDKALAVIENVEKIDESDNTLPENKESASLSEENNKKVESANESNKELSAHENSSVSEESKENPNISIESNSNVNTDKNPKTGDNCNYLFVIFMLSISGMAMVLLFIGKMYAKTCKPHNT